MRLACKTLCNIFLACFFTNHMLAYTVAVTGVAWGRWHGELAAMVLVCLLLWGPCLEFGLLKP